MSLQIDERHQLHINGSEQWIFARGNSAGPVLLFVHGGPGFPLTPIARAFEAPYRRNYLVVHWDQRGMGRAFKSTDFSVGFNLQQFVQDGLVITKEVRLRYPHRPVILIAHSWGTVVGVEMVAQAPEMFDVYISIGTNSDSLEIEKYRYEFLANKLMEEGQQDDLATLRKIGHHLMSPANFNIVADLLLKHIPFSWTWGAVPRDQVESAVMHCLEAGDYTVEELNDTVLEAMPQSLDRLYEDYVGFSAQRTVPRIDIPIYFVQGKLDFNTPSVVARKYFEFLTAPAGKNWIELENHGHMVMYEAPEKIVALLDKVVSKL